MANAFQRVFQVPTCIIIIGQQKSKSKAPRFRTYLKNGSFISTIFFVSQFQFVFSVGLVCSYQNTARLVGGVDVSLSL